jgi:hypothetical protein
LKNEQLDELVYQALETELGGVQIYTKAISCAVNEELRTEWQKYLGETEHHVEVVTGICEQLGLDTSTETPGRAVVRHLGESLLKAMDLAKAAGNPEAAELVAAECVVLAETKDHQNWELLGRVAQEADAKRKAAIEPAFEEVGSQEAEHLFHTMGWSRELWIQSLGMPAVLPPPEEQKSVETAIGAARAEQQRDDYLKS